MSDVSLGKRKREDLSDAAGEGEVEMDRPKQPTKKLLLAQVAASNLQITSFDRAQYTKTQKRFKYRLHAPFSTDEDEDLAIDGATIKVKRVELECWVMDNNACILLAPNPLDIRSVEFDPEKFQHRGEKQKTKIKKGVRVVNVGDIVAELVTSDTHLVYHLVSPIQGRLLELNDQLTLNPRLLRTKPQLDGFVAVLQSVLPEILGRCGSDILTMESDVGIDRLCFQWIRGNCPLGETCRYVHPTVSSSSSLLIGTTVLDE